MPSTHEACKGLLVEQLSPLVDVVASALADAAAALFGFDLFLHMLRPFGLRVAGEFEVRLLLLVQRSYGSWHVRFAEPLAERVNVQNGALGGRATYLQLFLVLALEMLMGEVLKRLPSDSSIYETFFAKCVQLSVVVPFETFNHPVAQVFVVTTGDKLSDLDRMATDTRAAPVPEYVDSETMLQHVLLVDMDGTGESVLDEIRQRTGFGCTVISMEGDAEEPGTYRHSGFTSIEQDLQALHLDEGETALTRPLPPAVETSIHNAVVDLISVRLLPYMESKVLQWDEQVAAPRKLITGKFFSVSRRYFSGRDSGASSPTAVAHEYDPMTGLYHRLCPEQVIRRLADWLMMLRDYKLAHAHYELLKKDFVTARAWAYSALAQEFAVVLMLLGQLFRLPELARSSHGLTRLGVVAQPQIQQLVKARNQMVEPYLDQLHYTYTLRSSLKTFSVRAIVLIVELLMCTDAWYACGLSAKWMTKLVGQELVGHVGRCLVLERVGEVYREASHAAVVAYQPPPAATSEAADDEEEYVNPYKQPIRKGASVSAGFTNSRKAALWTLRAARAWDPVLRPAQVQRCIGLVVPDPYDKAVHPWVARDGELLGKLTKGLAYAEAP